MALQLKGLLLSLVSKSLCGTDMGEKRMNSHKLYSGHHICIIVCVCVYVCIGTCAHVCSHTNKNV